MLAIWHRRWAWFPTLAKTKDETINGYFQTANYLDSAIKAFFDYLKERASMKNPSSSSTETIMEFLTPAILTWLPDWERLLENWSNYDNAMLQRVPFMVVMPGYEKGQIINTPTVDKSISYRLEHLGIESNSFLQVGQDSVFRSSRNRCLSDCTNSFVAPKYTSYDGRTYYTR